MRRVTLAAALLLSSAALAQAPGIVWEREYDFPNVFNDVVATSDGKIVCCGGTSTAGLDLWCYDGEGDLLWQTGGGGTYARGAARVISPPSGGFAVAGTCGLEYGSGHDLYVSRYDASGTAIWNTALERPQSEDYGCGIAALPDGGFAVCGYTTDATLGNQAWILRFDSEGDTLWTRTWGPTSYPDKAFAVEYSEGGITVLVQGRPEGYSQGRPLLLRYSMEGDLLWISNEMIGSARDLCGANQGYFVLRSETTATNFITRCDAAGFVLWDSPVICYGQEEMHTVRSTMDGGMLVAGADDYRTDPPPDDWNAHLSRYDSDGNWLWTLSLESGDDSWFYSAAQLSQGGYVAVGKHDTYEDVISRGYVVQFAPETGIEQPPLPSALVMEPCVPNPGIATFHLSWSSDLSGLSNVRVFDVSGRLRLRQDLGLLTEGQHSTQLDLQGLPSGCYLIVVSCGSERASTKVVLLR
jgi:hypothetical protein